MWQWRQLLFDSNSPFTKESSRGPKLNRCDRLFWVLVRHVWINWSEALVLVKPDTVVSWHRAGYRLFWKWRSRPRRVGRPTISQEVRQLIGRMKRENPTWGAPRIHGKLGLLGFDISEPSVSRYLKRLKRIPDETKAKQWLAFLNNHREIIAAFGRVEDWRHCPVGSAYPLLPVSVGSASVSEP